MIGGLRQAKAPEEARTFYLRALRLREQLLTEDSGNTTLQRARNVSIVHLGELDARQGRWEQARERFAEARASFKKLLDRDKQNVHLIRDLSKVTLALDQTYSRLGRPDPLR